MWFGRRRRAYLFAMPDEKGGRAFTAVFIAVVLGTALIVGAFLLHAARPGEDLDPRGPEFVRATGECASCHRRETSSIVHQYEASAHSREGVSCLECHAPVDGQQPWEHRGFTLADTMTAANCRQCHAGEYDQYLRSRHAAPSWAAVRGADDFTEEQIAHAERYHEGAVRRAANELAMIEGEAAMRGGCESCHDIGRPNADGTIGTCTECHSRHSTSVRLARSPSTCGQCHMGPDHSQLEIYTESKHGVMFAAMSGLMNLDAPPDRLTTADMPVPTCATCHMSGLEGSGVTHDTSERLSWWLFAPVSERRPNWARNQQQMQRICLDCHAQTRITEFYEVAEAVVARANEVVASAEATMSSLREEGLLTPEPFDEPLEFTAFDLWHYYGRTAKHGAFMGGADFVQWHGFYELTLHTAEIEEAARTLRRRGAAGSAGASD